MGIFDWDKSLSLGISRMDEQHRVLFDFMGNLFEAIKQKKEKEILMRKLLDLEEHTIQHFSIEEDYFKKFNYKEKESHIIQHKAFLEDIKILKEQIYIGSISAEDLLKTLVNWLSHHVKKIDIRYVNCFHENGLY